MLGVFHYMYVLVVSGLVLRSSEFGKRTACQASQRGSRPMAGLTYYEGVLAIARRVIPTTPWLNASWCSTYQTTRPLVHCQRRRRGLVPGLPQIPRSLLSPSLAV